MISNSLRFGSKLLTISYFDLNKSSNEWLRICVNSNKSKINSNYNIIKVRKLATKPKTKDSSSLSERKGEFGSQLEPTMGEKVKQTTKDISYLGVILGGISITGFIFYVVFKELFSSNSPNVIYSNALKKCKNDGRVVEAVGLPMKGLGEMTSRGRARHVSSHEYERDGKQLIRVKFYLKGSKTSATVHLETFKDSPKSEYRYLFVQLDSFPNKVIVLEDNRTLGEIPIR